MAKTEDKETVRESIEIVERAIAESIDKNETVVLKVRWPDRDSIVLTANSYAEDSVRLEQGIWEFWADNWRLRITSEPPQGSDW